MRHVAFADNVDNHSQMQPRTSETTLDRLTVGSTARIASIDWDALASSEGRRLRELGLYEGVDVEMLHRGALFFRDPLAVRIGRMRVVIRTVHAAAVTIEHSA